MPYVLTARLTCTIDGSNPYKTAPLKTATPAPYNSFVLGTFNLKNFQHHKKQLVRYNCLYVLWSQFTWGIITRIMRPNSLRMASCKIGDSANPPTKNKYLITVEFVWALQTESSAGKLLSILSFWVQAEECRTSWMHPITLSSVRWKYNDLFTDAN